MPSSPNNSVYESQIKILNKNMNLKEKTQSNCIGRHVCKQIDVLIGDFPPHKHHLKKTGGISQLYCSPNGASHECTVFSFWGSYSFAQLF